MRRSSLELDEEFQNYLNNEYGSFEVGNREFNAADIMFYLDPVEYEYMYTMYLNSNQIEEF